MNIGKIRILASFYGLVFGFVIGDLFGNTLLFVSLCVIVGFFVPLFLLPFVAGNHTNSK